jgi:hypothetical protein
MLRAYALISDGARTRRQLESIMGIKHCGASYILRALEHCGAIRRVGEDIDNTLRFEAIDGWEPVVPEMEVSVGAPTELDHWILLGCSLPLGRPRLVRGVISGEAWR